MRFFTTGVLTIALSIVAGASASAQTCVGYAPFANGPTRVSGDVSFADHATSYGAGVVFGASQPSLFGGASISGTRFDGTNETAKNLGLSGGFSVSSNSISLGGAIGHPFAASPTVTLVPFADLRWIHFSGKVKSDLGEATGSDNFGSLTLGAGIMFTKTVTLRPAIAIPIAEDNASTVFLISLGFNLGK